MWLEDFWLEDKDYDSLDMMIKIVKNVIQPVLDKEG